MLSSVGMGKVASVASGEHVQVGHKEGECVDSVKRLLLPWAFFFF